MESVDDVSSRVCADEHDVSDSIDTDNECRSLSISNGSEESTNCLKESKPCTSHGNGLSRVYIGERRKSINRERYAWGEVKLGEVVLVFVTSLLLSAFVFFLHSFF